MAVLIVVPLMVLPCQAAFSPTAGADPLLPRERHIDTSIRSALHLLEADPPVPIEVVELGRLSRVLRNLVKRTCAYVYKDVPRIYVVSSCAVYQQAATSRFDAMKLAAILRHEIAHLDGANEARARALEAETFRQLLRGAPPHLMTPGVVYAVALERAATAPGRRAPHQCVALSRKDVH